MVKNALVLILLALVSSCIRCDPPAIIDYGKIPDHVLKFVPYQNGQNYKFRHSGGLLIGFAAARQSRDEWLRCERCCDYEYKFEVNTTTLTPDYPVFSFGFELSNMDSVNFGFGAWVGHYWFQIPTNDYQASFCRFADSVLIGDRFYHDVFKVKSNYGSAYDRDTIYADSMYYCYKAGILQIIMSNDERYTIYE